MRIIEGFKESLKNSCAGGLFYSANSPVASLSSVRDKFNQPQEVGFHQGYLGGALEDWEEYVVTRFVTKSGASVLDIGCGTGREAFVLARRGFKVTGIDAAPRMIEAAQSQSRQEGMGIDFRVMSAAEMDFPAESFDYCIFSRAVYSFLPTRALRIESLRRIKKAMKTGGAIFVSVYLCPSRFFSRQNMTDQLRRIRNWLLPGHFVSEPGDVWLKAVSPASPSDERCFCHIFSDPVQVREEISVAGLKNADSGIENVFMAEA